MILFFTLKWKLKTKWGYRCIVYQSLHIRHHWFLLISHIKINMILNTYTGMYNDTLLKMSYDSTKICICSKNSI